MSHLPIWLNKRVSFSREVHELKSLLRRHGLFTVCESALCPNISECFKHKTATFLILGNVCTRNCRFCNVEKGSPLPVDEAEPERIAKAAKKLGLKFVVITSVTRDDLDDGGATQFAKTVRALTKKGIASEVLVPDFLGSERAISEVVDAKPTVFAHNVETVARLYPKIRPLASFERSLNVLKLAKEKNPRMLVKSSLIIGLGETEEEIEDTMKSIAKTGCDVITIGQYLRPNKNCLPVKKYWRPEFFKELEKRAYQIGFKKALCGPYVRSSYLAETLITSQPSGFEI